MFLNTFQPTVAEILVLAGGAIPPAPAEMCWKNKISEAEMCWGYSSPVNMVVAGASV